MRPKGRLLCLVMWNPDSWNTYDSLGEAYAAKGDKDLAIKSYEKPLELNPGSQTGKQALEALRK